MYEVFRLCGQFFSQVDHDISKVLKHLQYFAPALSAPGERGEVRLIRSSIEPPRAANQSLGRPQSVGTSEAQWLPDFWLVALDYA